MSLAMRAFQLFFILLFVAGCMPMGPASPHQSPNSIQRSKVLSSNEKSISIEHSDWGKPIAFQTANDHCASLGLVAVHIGSSKQFGPDVISTWRCE